MAANESNKLSKGILSLIVTTILPTIIASSLFSSVFATFYIDYYKTPFICIDIVSDNKSESSVRVYNYGRDSAKNLKVSIQSPFKIINGTIFSTDNISSYSNNELLYSIYLPKFSSGDGAIVNVNLFMNESQRNYHIQDLTVYTTHDKGSSKFTLNSFEACPDFVNLIFLSPYWPILIFSFIILILYFPLLYYISTN